VIYTYDCEFLEDGITIDLISIGIVCEDGREYYAVNSDFDQDRLKNDTWMVENVVANLPLRGKVNRHSTGSGAWYWSLDMTSPVIKPKWVIANEVREFLLYGQGTPELWAYYAAYDHVALAQLWGKMINLPKGIPMFTHDIMQQISMRDYGGSLPDQIGEHNALFDARWNMQVLRELTPGRF